ncbi:MAG: pitrilysin family protein [Verrucomicrobiota bacterium]
MPTSPAGFPLLPKLDTSLFTLDNGLELLVQEDHSAPVVSVQAWVQTGSIHEGRFLGAGISHLLEHLLFKGTDKRSSSQLAQQVQNVGGYINAYTSFDRTVYWMDLPSKGLPVALELLADAVFNSTLPLEEYAKEQEVIRREFAMGFDDPDQVAGRRLFASAYRVHPYQHPVIGHLSAFNALTREDVLGYYHRRYAPNNVFFVVAGAVDAESVREQLEGWVANKPRLALEPVWIPQEPAQIGRRENHSEFATELTRLHMAWHVPDVTHADIPALDLLAAVLGQGRSSRLYRRLRENDALVHSIDAWTYSPSEPGLFGVDAVLDPGKREVTQRVISEELDEILQNGVRSEELEKVRRMALSGQIGALVTARGRASDLGGNWLISKNPDLSRYYLEKLQAVQGADIQRVLERYVQPDLATVVSLNSKGSLKKPQVNANLSLRGEIQRGVLKNGLRTLLCEDKKLPLVTIVAVFKAGVLTEDQHRSGITRLFAKVLVKGTENRTAEVLAETLEAVGGGLGADGGNNSVSVSVRVLRNDLQLGLDVMADVLLNANFPQGVIDREKDAQLASIKAEDEDPISVAGRLMRENLMPGHPYALRRNGTPESVASISRETLQAYKDEFLVAKNGVLAVFGDIDAAELQGVLEQQFGGLASGKEALTQPQATPEIEAPVEVSGVLDKQQAVLFVGYRGADVFSPDRVALDLLDEACSDLGSRMFIRIREQLGLAYFVGSSQFVGLAPGAFAFYLGTDPLKRTAVLAELRDEIRQLAEHGLTEEELTRAKEKMLGAMEIRNQSLDALAVGCALDELYGLGAEHYRELRAQVQAVTLEGVREVAARYFAKQHPVIVGVGPESHE